MKQMRLLQAVGMADDELLTEYEQDRSTPTRSARSWQRWGLLAACLCLAITAALTLPGWLDKAGTPQQAQDSTVIGEKDNFGPGERPAGENMLIVDGSGYEADAAACYVSPGNGDILYFIEVQAALAEHAGTDARLFVGLDLFVNEVQLEQDDPLYLAELARLQELGYDLFYAEAWTYQDTGEQVAYTYPAGVFTVDELESFAASADYGYAFRFVHNGNGTCVALNRAGEVAPGYEEVVVDAAPLNPARELTQEEAYAEIGALLPESPPTGFVFESAYLSPEGSVSLLWCSGYDELSWRVSDYADEDAARLTAVGDTQNYDLALYPIPRADSVPDELWEIVDNPIFAIDELTLEAVEARAYHVNDAGDSQGWRMHFSVRYGELVVEISAKGVEPAWIFAQLLSIEP